MAGIFRDAYFSNKFEIVRRGENWLRRCARCWKATMSLLPTHWCHCCSTRLIRLVEPLQQSKRERDSSASSAMACRTQLQPEVNNSSIAGAN